MQRWCSALALLVVLVAGCSNKPATSDPEKAIKLMETFLETWKAGDFPASLKDQSPPITAGDPLWEDGAKLIKYEIDKNETKVAAFDVRCPVKVWVTVKGKEKGPIKIVYMITTSPNQVIVRDSGG